MNRKRLILLILIEMLLVALTSCGDRYRNEYTIVRQLPDSTYVQNVDFTPGDTLQSITVYTGKQYLIWTRKVRNESAPGDDGVPFMGAY